MVVLVHKIPESPPPEFQQTPMNPGVMQSERGELSLAAFLSDVLAGLQQGDLTATPRALPRWAVWARGRCACTREGSAEG